MKGKCLRPAIFISAAAAAASFTLAGCIVSGPVSTGTESVSETASGTFAFKKDPVTVNAFMLDTYISISAYQDVDEAVLKETLKLCENYEDMFSMQKEGSALYNLNENVTDRVPAELGQVISKALEWSAKSEGGFQISIGRVSELWDFTSGAHTIPSDEDMAAALMTVDDTKIRAYPADKNDKNSEYIVEKPAATKLDLGAVAKGYIADKLKEDLLSRGITSAVINLGGNVLCVGDKNGEPFNIGIRKPFAGDTDMITVLALKDCSAVSSGISERFFEENGMIYHHILNPETGYPYENDLLQTTVISKDSFTGDILSTLCYALGPDKALELCKSEADTELILVDKDYRLITSEGADKIIK